MRHLQFGLWIVAMAAGQVSGQAPKPNTVTEAAPPDPNALPAQVVIEREALRLIDPQKFQVPLQLRAVRELILTAPADGIVLAVEVEPGDRVAAQVDAVRLDNREADLRLDRAKAEYRAAQIELRAAAGTDEKELADAKLQAARAVLDLATFRHERNTIRVPFEGVVYRVFVAAGQYVRAGEPLLRFGDPSQLQVEIPVDRHQVEAGEEIEIAVEETPVSAQVRQILPLAEDFEPLRELIHSAASAVVAIENSDGRFHVGQAVFAPAIPRDRVTQIPTAALLNTPSGGRHLQILRDGVVRDLALQLHGQVGVEHIHVSGAFAEGDEVILKTSHPLPDGTIVRLRQRAEDGSAGVKPPRQTSTPAGGSPAPANGDGSRRRF